MKGKRIIALVAMFAVLMTTMPIISNAATSTSTKKTLQLEPVTHKGLTWKMANPVEETTTTDNKDTDDTSDDTTVTEVTDRDEIAYINEAGNLYCSTESRRILAGSSPYGIRLYSEDNADNMFNASNFKDDHEFEMKFRFTDDFYIMYYNGSYRHYIRFFNESELYYQDSTGYDNSVEVDMPWNEWHTLKLTSIDGNKGGIYLNGKKIVEYAMRASSAKPYFMLATYYHIDSTSAIEVEYAKMTPIQSDDESGDEIIEGDIGLSGVTQNQLFHTGDSVTLRAETSVGGDDINDKGNSVPGASVYSSYYVNGTKVGQDDVSTEKATKKVPYLLFFTKEVEYTIYTNNGFTYTFDQEGEYNIYAIDSKGKKSTTFKVFVENKELAELSVPESVNYGESVNVNISTIEISHISRYDYYVNGEKVLSSSSTSASLTGLRAGTAAISAKVICSDGSEYRTETKYIDVNKGAVSGDIQMSREYILDYDFDGTTGNVTVNDGFFELNFTHNGNTVTYSSNDGTKTYTGAENGIGAGSYRIVATAGNAEVYYNGHFLFSCLMPFVNNDIQSINYTGGVSNANLKASGVKAERYYGDWTTSDSIEVYDLDFDMFYSLEFNKENLDDETVVIYDGEHQAKLIFDGRGITAMAQPEDYRVPEEFNLTDSIETGYYRLTVARGLAQLFVNNTYINSFKCPVTAHAKAVMRTAVATDDTRFVSVKNTDDIYFHNEDFEGNTEYNANEYWFSEHEGRALEEGETDPFTQEIITEGGNSYLKLTDAGLEKEQYTGYTNNDRISQPVGDWNINASPDNPAFNFRAKADGTGEIHFLARHYQKGNFISISYSFTDGKWYLNRYTLRKESFPSTAKLVVPASDFELTDTVDGNVNISAIYASEREVLAESAENAPGTDWNDYEMILNDNYIALYCEGTKIIEYDGLVSGHGRMGFGVSYGATLCVDDVEYAGDSRITLALKYITTGDPVDASYSFYTGALKNKEPVVVSNTGFRAGHGAEDFHKSPTNGVVASSADYFSWKTLDNGNTWQPAYMVYEDNAFEVEHDGHYYLYYTGPSSLNLLSGMYMRIGSVNWAKPSIGKVCSRLYSTIHPEGDYKSTAQINGSWANENMVVDPADFPSEIYNQSNIASQLVQVQDGDYKGRIFMSKTIGGERYGGDAIFYTDVDRDFINSGASIEDYWDRDTNKVKKILEDDWYLAGHTLTYESVGFDIQESKVVDMPNSVLRAYGRGETGFISYCESYDGGETWEKGVPSQFIAPRCSYGVVRDPKNLNHYYAFWCYEANTSDKMNDGGRPRTRQALAGSFDGGKTWQYLADIEESTNDWRKGHDNKSLGVAQNHGLRVIDGVVYMSYAGFNDGIKYPKLYTLDTNKLKPLMRFTEVHDKKLYYHNGAQTLSEDAAILPKVSGKGKIYGTTTNITVTDEHYDAATIAKVMDAISNGNGSFNIGLTNYTVTPDANGNFDIIEAAEVFGKKVAETDNSFIISDFEISRVDTFYIDSIGLEKTAAMDIRDDFLNRFCLAVEYSNVEQMSKLLDEFSYLLDFDVDTVNESVLERMLGHKYYKLADIKKMYNMAVNANTKSLDNSPIALSTITDGYKNWDDSISGTSTISGVSDGVATVATSTAYSEPGSYGTAAFDIPDTDKYAVNFNAKIGSGEANIKWGNSTHLMQIVLNPVNNSGFEIENDKIPLSVTADKWYNICVLVSKAAYGRNAVVKIAEIADDGTVGYYTEYTFDGVTGTAGRKGFWLETANGGSASIEKVRVYNDSTFEVHTFKANDGKASASVEFLNLDKEISTGQAIMNIYNNDVFAGMGYSEELTDEIPVLGTKLFEFADVSYDVKNGINPAAKFSMWKDTVNLQSVATPTDKISMVSEFEDDFSGATLDMTKWAISADEDGEETGIFAGISAEEGGVLKLKKSVSGKLDFKAKLPAQADNMIVSYDFKVNAAPVSFQQQWFGSMYTKEDGTQALDRLVYYIDEDATTGAVRIKCGSSYTLNKGIWYSLIVSMTGVGGNREYKFYIKERDASDYQRLWETATITGGEYTSGASWQNAFRFYDGSSPNTDISFDNLKVISGTFAN